MKGGGCVNILQYKLNAIMAKSRALYGNRLKGSDYEALVNCSSVGEIAAYLRSSTPYSYILTNISSSDISAGYLEFIIRKSELEVFDKLYRYEVAFGQSIYEYFVMNSEIVLLLSKVRSIILGNTDEAAFSMPQLFSASKNIDMYVLAKADTMEALTEALGDSPYRKITAECFKNGLRDYIDYECAFVNYFNEYQYALVKKCCGKGSELTELLAYKADTEFINKICRTKRNFSASSDRILRSTAPMHLTNFTQNQIKQLLSAESESSVLDVLSSTQYRDYASEIRSGKCYIEQATAHLNYKKYKHLLRFGTDPNVVMFCFMFLIENEISNLIHIIEGVKYKMDADSIKKLLIGVGD